MLDALFNPPDSAVLKRTKSGTTTFGTSDIRDLSDGQFPVEVWRVDVSERDGRQEAERIANARKPSSRDRRVREARSGWRSGWTSHVEIRNGPRPTSQESP